MKLFNVAAYLLFAILFLLLSVPFSKDVISIPDEFKKKDHKATIILPDKYHYSNMKYPVIYLLHGYGGNHSMWSRIVPLEKYSDSCQIIFVCPDGNFDSWYIDSPIKPDSKYESYIIETVIPFIDKKYRSISETEGRAICGSSMGGHGALTLICRHPNTFCAASSISGILDLTQFPENWNIKRILGDMNNNKQIWIENSFLGTMINLCVSKKPVLIDCGLSDFALQVNRTAHKKLDSLKVFHYYNERSGNHSAVYSQKVFKDHLNFLKRYLKSAY